MINHLNILSPNLGNFFKLTLTNAHLNPSIQQSIIVHVLVNFSKSCNIVHKTNISFLSIIVSQIYAENSEGQMPLRTPPSSH